MIGTPYLYKDYVGGDFIIEEVGSPAKTREAGSIHNAGSTALIYDAGYPMKGATYNTPVAAGDEANVLGLLVEKVTVLPGQTIPVAVIVRGCVINADALPTTDAAGGSYTLSSLITALSALNGVTVRREPTRTQTQTT